MLKLYNVVRQYDDSGTDPDVFPIFLEHRPTMDKALDMVAEEMGFDHEDLDDLEAAERAGLVAVRGAYDLPTAVTGSPGPPGPDVTLLLAALAVINAHRRTLGQAPLDPKDWTPKDVFDEAERVARLPNEPAHPIPRRGIL